MNLHDRVLQEVLCPLCPKLRTIVREVHQAAVTEQEWCQVRERFAARLPKHRLQYVHTGTSASCL